MKRVSGNCQEIKRYYGKLKPTGFVDEEREQGNLFLTLDALVPLDRPYRKLDELLPLDKLS